MFSTKQSIIVRFNVSHVAYLSSNARMVYVVKTLIIMWITALHSGQLALMSAKRRGQFSQNLAWLHAAPTQNLRLVLEFCTGAVAVKSRGKTVGVPREREERPPFIPRECRERDCLLRKSRGTGSKRRSPPAGAIVTPASLVGLLLLLFGLCLSLSLYLSCFRFLVHGGD